MTTRTIIKQSGVSGLTGTPLWYCMGPIGHIGLICPVLLSGDHIMPPINAGSLVIIKLIHVREIKTDNKRAILCVSKTYNES